MCSCIIKGNIIWIAFRCWVHVAYGNTPYLHIYNLQCEVENCSLKLRKYIVDFVAWIAQLISLTFCLSLLTWPCSTKWREDFEISGKFGHWSWPICESEVVNLWILLFYYIFFEHFLCAHLCYLLAQLLYLFSISRVSVGTTNLGSILLIIA